MPQITQIVNKTSPTGRIIIPPYASHNSLAQRTVMAYIYPTLIDTTLRYVYAKSPTGNGPRFYQVDGGQWTYGTESTGVALRPNRGSLNSPSLGIPINAWSHVCTTHDGGVLGTSIRHFWSRNGATLAEVNGYQTANDGSGSIVSDSSNNIYLFDRDAQDRGWQGRCAYVAVWNRVLSVSEMQQAKDNGPLSVQSGLVFLWANNQDLTGLSPTPTANTAPTTTDSGLFPPILTLGPDTISGTGSFLPSVSLMSGTGDVTQMSVTGSGSLLSIDASINASGDVTQNNITGTSSLLSNVSQLTSTGDVVVPNPTTLDLAAAYSNINASTSSVTNGSTATPSLNIKIRLVEDGEWQQYFYKVDDVANKTLTNNIELTGKEVDTSYLGTYDGPWWTHDINDHTSWQKVPSFNVSGTPATKTFTISPGTHNTIWVASTIPNTDSQVISWINSLEITYPTLVHDDLRSRVLYGDGSYILGRTLTGVDENGRSISNLPFRGFRIGNDLAGNQSPNAKPVFVIMAGVHAMEWHGFHQMQGFVDTWITTPSLVDNIDLYVYPHANPNGSWLGFRRNCPNTTFVNNGDLNRNFTTTKNTLSTAIQWRTILETDCGGTMPHVVGFIDFHDGRKSSDKAWFYTKAGQANNTAIASAVSAEDPELDRVDSSVLDTTTDYFLLERGVSIAMTCELADEKSNITEIKGYGSSYARAMLTLYNGGWMPLDKDKRFSTINRFEFETDLEGFIQDTGTFPWTRLSGSTPTADTGPAGAARGTFYAYSEATGSAIGNTFIARKNFDFSKIHEIQFEFNRFGNTGSTFTVDVWNGSSWINRFSTTTNSSNQFWRNGFVDVSDLNNTDGAIRFVNTITASPTSTNDTAIDNVRVYEMFENQTVVSGSGTLSSEISLLNGQGVISVAGTGGLLSQNSTVTSSGTLLIGGTGSLLSSNSSISSSGEVNGFVSGNSLFVVTNASISALGEVEIVIQGVGSLQCQQSLVGASGDVSGNPSGTGNLITQQSELIGFGVVYSVISGSGSFVSEPSLLTASGTSVFTVLGSASLISTSSVLFGNDVQNVSVYIDRSDFTTLFYQHSYSLEYISYFSRTDFRTSFKDHKIRAGMGSDEIRQTKNTIVVNSSIRTIYFISGDD